MNNIDIIEYEKINSDITRYLDLFIIFGASGKPMNIHLNLKDVENEIDVYHDWSSDEL